MRIQCTGWGCKVTLEAGEHLRIAQEDDHRLSLSYGDKESPGPENWVETDVIHIEEVK